MKQEDRVFDEMIRQKMEQRSFGSPASGWAKAEKLIDASQTLTPAATVAGIKLSTIIVSFLATSIVVAGIVYVSTNNSETSAETTPVANTIATTGNPQNTAPASSLSLQDAGATNASGNTNDASSDVQSVSGHDALKHDVAGNNSPVHHTPQNVAPGNAQKPPVNPGQRSGEQREESPLAVNSPPENKEEPVNTPADQNIAENVPQKNAGAQIPENDRPGENKAPVNGSPENNSGNANENSVAPESATENPMQSLVVSENSNPGVTEQNNPVVAPEKIPGDSTENFIPSNNPVTGPLAQQDSTGPAPDQHDSIPSMPAPSLTVNYWLIQAGATYVLPFSAGNKSGQSINPVIGGGYNFRIGRKWSLQAGLRYTFINNASDTSSSTFITTYGFGVTNHYTETRMQRLHYFSLPVQAYWRINGRHSLTAGGALNYMAYSENRERSYSETSGTLSQSTYRTIFGHTPGLNRFDGMLFAGYSLTAGQHFSIEASFYYGLTDIKNNDAFGVNRFERNKGFMLLLQYAF